MNIQEISVENLVISPFNVRQLLSNDDEIKNLSSEKLEAYIFILCNIFIVCIFYIYNIIYI